ncbi:AAA family ATPase [Candidatus Woesearchaeota archaeon]|nr:AAA family ATPase [Candidatus Woesearchaeota archaeon]
MVSTTIDEVIVTYDKGELKVYEAKAKEKKALSKVRRPALGDQIEVPVNYAIETPDGSSLGTVISYKPQREEVLMQNGTQASTLKTKPDNQGLVLNLKGGRVFDVETIHSLDDLAGDERAKLEGQFFTKGYRLHSSQEKVTIDVFEKDGQRRAVLHANNGSDYTNFLQLLLYDTIEKDLEGKELKEKEAPKPKRVEVVRKVELGPYARFVLERFSANMLDEAFEYMDQNGESRRFFEYMDDFEAPVLLNGPTGNGKSVLAMNYAFARKLPYYADRGQRKFDPNKTIGSLVPGAGQPFYAPGPLLLSMIHGGVYALEEGAHIHPDDFTAFNIILERGEVFVNTHLGPELIKAQKNWKYVVLGNFHAHYTSNEWTDANLQRFVQLKFGYPSKDLTSQILLARAPGLEAPMAGILSQAVEDLREVARRAHKDLGLKGLVRAARRLTKGTDIPLITLLEEEVVNPLTTYENNIEKKDGKLYTALMDKIKHLE